MKYFIGIVPPLATKDRVLEIQKRFSSNKVPYFNEPHITLKAPSGLTEDKSWIAKVTTLVGNTARFDIKLDGIDGFEDRVLFLSPVYLKELIDMHMNLIKALHVSVEDQSKFYEGDLYHPHMTLGETSWGGMTVNELQEMRKLAETEFGNFPIPEFQVSHVRVFQKELPDDPFVKFLDIPFKI